jgi:hemolysin III
LFDLRDPVSSSTHIFTCLWAIFATLLLWRLTRGDRWRRLSVTVYGLSMVVLYAASGLFHGLQLPREQLRFYQKLDQSAIYGLIAGTCTPVMAMLLTGRLRTSLLAGIWMMAFTGIACMWLLPKAPHSAMVGIYLGMGWMGLMAVWQYYKAVGWRAISWAMAGAGFYTFGAICELTKWPVIWRGAIESHEVLHVSDSIGTFCHFVFIVRYVMVYQRRATAPEAPELEVALAPHTLNG